MTNSRRNEIIITVLAVGTYLICLLNDFHTDDWIVSSLLRDGLSFGDFVSMENPGRFRPLTNIILYMRYLAFGDTAWPYYLLNIVLHALITILIYRLLSKLGFEEKTALVSSLFFAAYFQHYEAVIWLYGTIREMALLAYIACFWMLYNHMHYGNRKTFWLYVVFSSAGMFVVEDFVVAPLVFIAFIVFFSETGIRPKLLKSVIFTGMGQLAIYFALRTVAIKHPGIAETYYYPGLHIIRMLFEYMGWFLIPSPAHPYFQHAARSLPETVYYLWRWISYLGIFGFLPLSVWLYLRSPRRVRFFILFVFISLLPIIPLNYKVGSRNIYIPSMGLAVMAGYAMTIIWNRQGKSKALSRAAAGALAVYLGVGIAAVAVASLEYRRTQLMVSDIVDDLQKTAINLNNYDFVLLDHVPGRAVIGPAMIYRLRFERYLMASNDPVKGPLNIANIADSLYASDKSLVVFDYRKGHMVEATADYIPQTKTEKEQ